MMTPEMAAGYERAAVALAEGRLPAPDGSIRDRAFAAAAGGLREMTLSEMRSTCRRAARILRDCIEKSEPLP